MTFLKLSDKSDCSCRNKLFQRIPQRECQIPPLNKSNVHEILVQCLNEAIFERISDYAERARGFAYNRGGQLTWLRATFGRPFLGDGHPSNGNKSNSLTS